MLNIHWKDWCWSLSFNTLATWCKELTHWKRLWCLQWFLAVLIPNLSFSSVAHLCPTLCDPMNRSTPGLPVHHHLRSSLRLTSIESVMSSSHLILCRPLLLLPPIPPSIRVFSNESNLRMRWTKYWSFNFTSIRDFSNESTLHIRCPKYWSFNFSISPSNEYSGLISFRIDWFDLLAVQGTLKSLLQYHNSKVSVL